jgi:hypothetical protein
VLSFILLSTEKTKSPLVFLHSVDNLLNRLAIKFTSNAYDILRCNCNHFTDELCLALSGCSIPEW